MKKNLITLVANGRLVLTISEGGIETVGFVSPNKDASLHFYSMIAPAVKAFEKEVQRICNLDKVKSQNLGDGEVH